MDVSPMTVIADRLAGIVRGFFAVLPQLAAALLILALTYLVSRAVDRLVLRYLRSSGLRPALIVLFDNLALVVVWLTGFGVAGVVLFPGVSPADLVAAFGIGSVALGFALRNTLENFVAGMVVLSRKAMRIGDIIETADYHGRVERITVRETHVRQLDGQLVILPNSLLFSEPVRIMTDLPRRRHELVVQVAYETDLDHAQGVLEAATTGLKTVDYARDVEVYTLSFDDSGISFLIRWWAGSSPREGYATASEMAKTVHRALNGAGIEIPFPHRSLLFKGEPFELRHHGDDPSARDAA